MEWIEEPHILSIWSRFDANNNLEQRSGLRDFRVLIDQWTTDRYPSFFCLRIAYAVQVSTIVYVLMGARLAHITSLASERIPIAFSTFRIFGN